MNQKRTPLNNQLQPVLLPQEDHFARPVVIMTLKTRQQEEEEKSAESSLKGGDKSPQKPIILPGFSSEQAQSLNTYLNATIALNQQKMMAEINDKFDTMFRLLAPHPSIEASVSGRKEGEVEQQQEQYYNVIVPVKKLRAEDVGFFDPEYVAEKSRNAQVVNAGKHVIYRDVYTFVNRLKDLAYAHGDTNTVTAVIPECFRGGALMWYTAELSDLEKSGLRASDLGVWYSTLIDRWRMQTSVALATLTSSSFGLHDIRHQSPRAWIQQMLHCAKAANFDSTHNQLTMIWNRLNVNIRRDIPEPLPHTSLAQFFKHIDSKTSIWREMADRPPPQQYMQQRQYHSPQQQHPYRPPQQTRGGENRANQGRFAPRIPIDGKQHAFPAEVTADGNGAYEDEDGHEYYVSPAETEKA